MATRRGRPRARPIADRLPDPGTQPARTLLYGYLAYMAVGWALLMMPFSQEVPVAPLDALFIATSAVSTTGLITVDPGGSFTRFGEGVILALIQFGGLGYMTVGSVTVMALRQRLSIARERTARTTFELPDPIDVAWFLRAVALFTLAVEAAGTAILYMLFSARGIEEPFWQAFFHAISAFCTAGFSLFPDSLERFSADPAVSLTIATLSILGAMGFLIVVDTARSLTMKRRRLGYLSKVILAVTGGFLALGTVILALADPVIAALPLSERLQAAFFQVMTATTTVGFNTVPISSLTPSIVMVLIFLMVVGASPAGTGGGLKTTTFASLYALVACSIQGYRHVALAGRRLGEDKLRFASASLAYYCFILVIALAILLRTEPGADLQVLLFEAVSAMGTVGLSLGITGDLSAWGKLTIIVLMTAGRLGLLTFGIALWKTVDPSESDGNDSRPETPPSR